MTLDSLPRNEQPAFRLGELTDQLIHPPLCRRAFQYLPAREVSTEGAQELDSATTGIRRPSTITWLEGTSVGSWPDAEWLRTAEHALAHFSQCTGKKYEGIQSFCGDGASRSQILEVLKNYVFDLEGEPDDSDGLRLSHRGTAFAKRLGLEIDVNGRCISTGQLPTPRGLAPRQLMLLLYLLNQGGTPVPVATIAEN
ncbi:MAG: hypothetical protein KDA58_09005, partial [Planctomycetaceae bacterium]|nr:hypothetical protein [Planctomycetaceae bacterium]